MALMAFGVLATLSVISALGVILHKSPVRSALLLVTNFVGLAGLYLLQNAQVLAVFQILVYAGAIMVLFLFVIMLLNLAGDTSPDPLAGQKWVAWLLGVALVGGIGWGMWSVAGLSLPVSPQGIRATAAEQQGIQQVQVIGFDLFTRYVYPFELTSVLLLVGVIGVMTLTRRIPQGGSANDRS